MDLNQKYSDYQEAVMRASVAPDSIIRALHLDRATLIAGEIESFQSKLGAAASCAWSAQMMSTPQLTVAALGAAQDS
jgi:hypothetical protein